MPKVKVYSAEWCPYCHLVADFLKANKIEFELIDVDKVPGAAEELVEKSGQSGIPVVDIDGKIFVGFDKEALKKALKLK
jgi:glutaredoxin-like YruB-family protein